MRRGTRRGSRSVSAPSHQQSWRGETERLNPLAFASHLTEASFRRGAATTPSFSRALLDVSGGRVGYRRTLVRVDNERDANLDRFEQPAGLDLVTVELTTSAKQLIFLSPRGSVQKSRMRIISESQRSLSQERLPSQMWRSTTQR